jgi:drug/metabolite transporter (DMT)-like permease
MVAAMAGFAVEDMILKSVARSLPVGEILILFGTGGMLAFASMARSRGERVLHPAILSPVILVRAVFEASGRLFYTLAIALTPLSSASAILQATPIVVVLGAALVFGETVGWRRWLAVALGFAGVLIILRPGAEGFSALSLLAVAGLLGFAGRDLATRAAPPVLSNLQLGIYGFAMMIPAGLILLALWGGMRLPDGTEALGLLAATVVGVAAYFSLTVAMRTGEVSVVTPFRYSRLVFAIALGALAFGERPDATMILGSVLVVGSGLYTLLTARRGQTTNHRPEAGT